MATIITFKFLIEENGKQTGDIRRVTLKAPVSLDALRDAAKDILGWSTVSFRFKDEDGDFVTVASQHELDTAIALANGAAVRFTVVKQEPVAEAPKVVEAPKVAAAPVATPGAEAAPAPAAAAAAAATPDGVSALEAATDATIPENVMVQFSVIAEFFQRMAQQMAEFAPRIPAIVNEGIRKMSSDFAPLDVSVEAARDDKAPVQLPPESFGLVIHRLPESVVHPGVECSHCHKKPITGMRYKCVQCDCDLCQDCIVLPNVHTEGHRFLPVCAPAVGSHFVNTAKEGCAELKTRAAPVIEKARTAVDEAVVNARAKGAEIGDKVKQQVETVKGNVEKTVKEAVEKKQAPAATEATITEKERGMLQQLRDMGFTDQEKLLPLIRKHKDLSRVIEALIR